MTKDSSVVIAGVADLVGKAAANQSPDALMVRVATRALEDAGIDLKDVDGVFCASPHDNMPTLRAASVLGIAPRYFDGTSIGGASYESFVTHAALALQAGACDVALILYSSAQRSARGKFSTRSAPPVAEAVSGMLYPVSSFAMMASRYMETYGSGPDDLAAVAVSAREWARHHPAATSRDPLSIEDVLSSRMVSEPLRKLDCCLVTDGAGAVVMTRADRAQDLPRRPVKVLGGAEGHTHRFISDMPDLLTTAASTTVPDALRAAKIGLEEIDVFQVYDAFTIDVLLILEDMGLCSRGEAGAFVKSGATSPGGAAPLNTNGGGLSYAHPGMNGIFLLIEAVRQLRQDSPGLVVEGAETALVHGLGGPLSSGSTVVLGVEDVS